ncbi:MAG TPA: DUF2124 domain-containing protein, partial [Anaerolineae bacterium]|nr:DUF2124 domain-containing protein [Anaerolineae bacterium]
EGSKVVFTGSVSVCTPFIELLAYAVRDRGFDMVVLSMGLRPPKDAVNLANKLGISQPAVTQQIKFVENYLGTKIIELLKEMGLREKYHVTVGGAPVTEAWAREIGADSWGENAAKAVAILEKAMAERRKGHASATL